MQTGAPRLSWCQWPGSARGAWRMLCLGLALLAPTLGVAEDTRELCVKGDGPYLQRICFLELPEAPDYGHEVLGDTPEWDALSLQWGPAAGAPEPVTAFVQSLHVFEDIAPRVIDLDGDNRPEIVVVQSGFTRGARLMVLRIENGLHAATTPYIGQRNRWLAPIGAADLDGDGHVELAYIDRPHLAKRLRIWRYEDGALTHVTDHDGLTNHAIGEDWITGGIRQCDSTPPEMIVLGADRRRVVAVTFDGKLVRTRDLAPYRSRAQVESLLKCG